MQLSTYFLYDIIKLSKIYKERYIILSGTKFDQAFIIQTKSQTENFDLKQSNRIQIPYFLFSSILLQQF